MGVHYCSCYGYGHLVYGKITFPVGGRVWWWLFSRDYGHEMILTLNTSLRILEGGWREYGSGFIVVMYL